MGSCFSWVRICAAGTSVAAPYGAVNACWSGAHRTSVAMWSAAGAGLIGGYLGGWWMSSVPSRQCAAVVPRDGAVHPGIESTWSERFQHSSSRSPVHRRGHNAHRARLGLDAKPRDTYRPPKPAATSLWIMLVEPCQLARTDIVDASCASATPPSPLHTDVLRVGLQPPDPDWAE